MNKLFSLGAGLVFLVQTSDTPISELASKTKPDTSTDPISYLYRDYEIDSIRNRLIYRIIERLASKNGENPYSAIGVTNRPQNGCVLILEPTPDGFDIYSMNTNFDSNVTNQVDRTVKRIDSYSTDRAIESIIKKLQEVDKSHTNDCR